MTKRNTKQVGHIKAGVLISFEYKTGRKKHNYGTWLCHVNQVRHSKGGAYTVRMVGVKVKDRYGNAITGINSQQTFLWKSVIREVEWSLKSYPLVEPGSELDLLGGEVVRGEARSMAERVEEAEKSKAERKKRKKKIQNDQYQEELIGVGFRMFGFLILEMAEMKIKDFPSDVLRLVEPNSEYNRVYPIIGFGKLGGHLTAVYRWREGRSGVSRLKLHEAARRGYRIVPPTIMEAPDHVVKRAAEMIAVHAATTTDGDWNQSYTLVEVDKEEVPEFDFGRVQMEEREPETYAFGRDFADLVSAGHVNTIDDLRNVCWDSMHNVYWMQIS